MQQNSRLYQPKSPNESKIKSCSATDIAVQSGKRGSTGESLRKPPAADVNVAAPFAGSLAGKVTNTLRVGSTSVRN